MLDYPEAKVDTAVAAQAGHPAVVEVRGLRYSYPEGFPALRGVDLALAPGEKVALVGPNGAGKSTLLLHLNGILRGGEGEVRMPACPSVRRTWGVSAPWWAWFFRTRTTSSSHPPSSRT